MTSLLAAVSHSPNLQYYPRWRKVKCLLDLTLRTYIMVWFFPSSLDSCCLVRYADADAQSLVFGPHSISPVCGPLDKGTKKRR